MKVLIRNARIDDIKSSWNKKRADLLVDGGKIAAIGKGLKLPKGAKEISSRNTHVSLGWIDLKAHFGQPGFEERESLESGAKAAAAGGFTEVCLLPSLLPVTDNRSTVEFFHNALKNNVVTLRPYGAISTNLNGKDLAELYDMNSAGAIGFTDDLNFIQNPKLLQIALQYAKGFDGLVISHPLNTDLAGKGNVNEGTTSTSLGLKGIPHFAEEIQVSRDLKILEYTEGRLHFTGISSLESVRMISKAKKQGLDVSCDVASYLLCNNDSVLHDFDSNYKTLPPIRSEKDRKGLIRELANGNIDAVVSDHRPMNIERKDCEFEIADYGMSSVQTVLPNMVSAGLGSEQIAITLAEGPRRVLRRGIEVIEEGQAAHLTIYDPSLRWEFNEESNFSLSSNSPLLNTELTGKVLAVCNKSLVSFF